MSSLQSLWDDAYAASLSALGQLRYRSNLLGSDQRITNTGGGNTSAKLRETDPVTGQEVSVLWVKGSGGDLRTADMTSFASLYLEDLIQLQQVYHAHPQKGLKQPGEDAMVGMLPHCTFNLNPRAASIDTPLHGFLPFTHIDHTHPNAIIAIAASENAEALTREIFGGEIGFVPWMRPGFELGLAMQEIVASQPHLKGLVMGKHGLINWGDTGKECYLRTLELIQRAQSFIDAKIEANGGESKVFGGATVESLHAETSELVFQRLLPWLRGQVSVHKRLIATIQCDEATLQFVNSHSAPALAKLGTSCPDHFLRTKIRPLYVVPPAFTGDLEGYVANLKATLTAALAEYRQSYAEYYERCKHENSPAMRDAHPSVILIPGLGMIAFGKDKSESRVTAEFYGCAIQVMRGAEALSSYTALPEREAFDIEYWLLEEAKLKRMPAEKELARRIAVVIGAGSGIGREIALRLAKEGAAVVCADLNSKAASETADLILSQTGLGIGVAGSGVSNCGPALPSEVSITDRQSIAKLFEQAIWAYGGIDIVVLTAAIFPTPEADGTTSDAAWDRTLETNVKGSYLVADEAAKLWKAQGLPGSLVLTSSVNAVVSKKGSLVYDVSKSAVNHLVRELAIELAPLVRVNGLAPATVVDGSSMFPRARVLASLRKYNLEASDDEPTETLVERLASFYASRTLTQSPVKLADQAEAVFLMASNRLSKTTGQILTVDGGLIEAFLR